MADLALTKDIPGYRSPYDHEHSSLKHSFLTLFKFLLVIITGTLFAILIAHPSTTLSDLHRRSRHFSIDNVISIVREITKHGPHPMGSPAQNDQVIPFIFDLVLPDLETLAIENHWNTNYTTFCDSGTVHLHGIPESYFHVCIAILSISPPNVDPNSPGLVISAHLDSIHWAPGAFDNGVNVALGIELVKAIASTPEHLLNFNHPIHLIIGDGEELGLFHSHVVVTNFPHLLGFVLNLESVGFGGRMSLFRWTRDSEQFILRHCTRANRLLISETGADILNSGAVDSMSDYYHYSKFAPTADFVFAERSDRYHTMYDRLETDKEEEIMRGSVKEGLTILFDITKSYCESNVDVDSPENKRNTIVFSLPLFGNVLLGPYVSLIFHSLILVGTVCMVLFLLSKSSKTRRLNHSLVNWSLIVSIPVLFLVLPFLMCGVFSYLISLTSSMSFHRFPKISTVFFSFITLSGLLTVHSLLSKVKNSMLCSIVSVIPFFVIYLFGVTFQLGSAVLFGFVLISSMLLIIPSHLRSKNSKIAFLLLFVSTFIIAATTSPVAYMIFHLLPGNFARVTPNFPSTIIYSLGVCVVSVLLLGPLCSVVYSFKRTNSLYLAMFFFVMSLPLLLLLMFSIPFSPNSPLRYTIQHEILPDRNDSRIALLWPHPASLSLLEQELLNNGFETTKCQAFVPLLENAVCVNAEEVVIDPPVINYQYDCDDNQCDVILNVTTSESGRLAVKFPSDVDVVYEGYEVGRIMKQQAGVVLNFAKPANSLVYKFSFKPSLSELQLTTLFAIHRTSSTLDSIVNLFMPQLTPWGKSWLIGTTARIENITLSS
ncbi:hypothetical protein P9112_011589 [Eukaryota sp. TZLM1-RC]